MSKQFDFSGIWKSTYRYPSSSRKDTFVGEHFVQFFRAGNELVIQSTPNESGSYLIMRLTLDDRILTGTWHEYTSQEGHYKGAIYYGAIQLVIDESANTIRGKWVGFTKDMHVESDEWTLTRTDEAHSRPE